MDFFFFFFAIIGIIQAINRIQDIRSRYLCRPWKQRKVLWLLIALCSTLVCGILHDTYIYVKHSNISVTRQYELEAVVILHFDLRKDKTTSAYFQNSLAQHEEWKQKELIMGMNDLNLLMVSLVPSWSDSTEQFWHSGSAARECHMLVYLSFGERILQEKQMFKSEK